MTDVVIRPMVATDIETVARIERQSFTTNWTTLSWINELSNPFAIYLVVEHNKQVLGHCGFHLVMDEAHITTLAVAEPFRNQKLGERLLVGLLETARSRGATCATLEVRRGNAPAQHLYAKYDFRWEGTRRGYYDGEDGDILWVRRMDDPGWKKRFTENRERLSTSQRG